MDIRVQKEGIGREAHQFLIEYPRTYSSKPSEKG